LRGKKIFIAPGHDKNTVGATTKDGKVRELEVNLEDSLILRDILRGMGATVELSRETNDVALQPPEIAAKSNAFGADMFIGIHHDSRSDDPQGAGHILIYYRNLNGCDARCEEDKKLANLAIGSLENLGGKEKSRGIVGDKVRDATQGLVQLEQANAPVAVIVEVNQIDDPRVTQESYQKQAMQIIADAVEEYFGASAPVAASSLKPGWCGVLDNDVGEHGIAAYNKKFNQPDLTWEQVLEQGASGRATKEILCGILHVESHGNAFSHSSAGAMCGLQVMPPYMENYPNPYCSTFSDNSVAASVCGKWPAWHGTGELAPYNAYPTAEDGASDPKSVFHPLNCVKAAVQEFNLWYDRCEKSAQLRNEGETLEHCAIRHYGPAGSTTYVAMVEDWVGKAKEGIA
jgi:N-acetylmuramoyl-L-alanine amidase